MIHRCRARSISYVTAGTFLLLFSHAAFSQVCRISVAGLNQSRRVAGAIHAECPPDIVHSAPFGNWGVSSNFGQKGNSHQFDGWCHNSITCDSTGSCRVACTDGWYEWNSCTDHTLYRAPNCTLYNAAACTEQATSTGINVHGTKFVDMPVSCPKDSNGDGVPDAGGCLDVAQYSSGTNFMSLYELDPICCDQLVQTVYFPPVTVPLSCDALGCAPAASTWLDPTFWDSPSSPGKIFAQMAVAVNWGAFVNTGGRCSVPAASANVASAASFHGPSVAPDSIATIFGNQLSPATEQATAMPLPLRLAGVSVSVTDRTGVTREAPLFFVSPQQINFLVPGDLAAGPAALAVQSSGLTRSTGKLQIDATAPGIFTQNADGKGVPAAIVVRIAADGSSSSEPVFSCGAAPGSCEPAPINLRAGDERVYLILFGTGIRHSSSLGSVTLTIAGKSLPVEYAGPQGEYAGLDQVNVFLPIELAGSGLVDVLLTVDSSPANVVRLSFR
jgi:uncharacterized protein (TIGR03437 family)